MRKPTEPEVFYLDFNGFFASCSQYAHPHLRGKPVGITPFEGDGNVTIIACSGEAKARGVKNVMRLSDARRLCPDLVLWPQEPDLYRRAHNYLMSEIMMVSPVDAVKSIDELCCTIGIGDRQKPERLGLEIKRRLRNEVGPWITCSIGYAANRLLAKMACKAGKRDGNNVWHPRELPAPLRGIPISDVPGIGSRMQTRLYTARITTMDCLLETEPRQLRKIWNSVVGERMWYALHGYDIKAEATTRSQYGHGRVLPPEHRRPDAARPIARILTTKAARRMRRDGYSAGMLSLGLFDYYDSRDNWGGRHWLPTVNDDSTILRALESLWAKARQKVRDDNTLLNVEVCLDKLTPTNRRQLDFLADDEVTRLKQESMQSAVDGLNHRYGGNVVTLGVWQKHAKDHLGAKISFNRIPRAEDAW